MKKEAKDKQVDAKVELNLEIEKTSEIKEALEAMERIITVEDAKARVIIEQSPRYYQIR